MKTFLSLIVISLVLALYLPVFAQGSDPASQAPLVLTGEQGQYPLGLHMAILEDPSGELTIADVTSPEYAASFVPSQDNAPNYGYSDSAFWLRFRLRNEDPSTNLWLLEVNFQNLNYVDLYLPAEDGGYTVKQTGAVRPFDTRDIPFYHMVFELPLTYRDEQTFYIRVKTGSSVTLGFTLWSPAAFAMSKSKVMLNIGLFYGALLIMLGYHVFLFFSLKERVYFYFVLFLAASILFFATYEGIADQYLWTEITQYKLIYLVFTQALFFIAALLFSDAFLEQKTRAPVFHKLFLLFMGYWALMIVIVPFASYLTMSNLTAPFIFTTPVLAASAGFYTWRRGHPQAAFYLVSWLGFILGIMTVELVRLGVFPSRPGIEKAYQIGLIWLVTIWSLALARRIDLLKQDAEKANRKLLRSQSQLAQTLDGMPVGVVVYGTDRRPVYANPPAYNILSNPQQGIQPGIAARRTVRDAMNYYSFRLVGSDVAYPIDKFPIWQAFEGQSASVDDIEADLIDRRVSLEIWANPVVDESGRVESVVAAFQDITQRKAMETELDDYRQQLEKLVEQRTGQLSAANARLNAEISQRQRLEDMLRLRLDWLIVVNQVYQSVANRADLPFAYDQFVDKARGLFGSSEAFLAEIDPQGNGLILLSHTCQADNHPALKGSFVKIPSVDLSPERLRQADPISLSRSSLGVLEGPLGAHYQEARCQLLALAPLHCQDDTFGLLGLEFQETDRLFSVEECALIEKICLDITQVREKARLGEQTRVLIAAEERNRLARDLHDSVTQMLFAASLIAEVLPQMMRRDPKQAYDSLEELHRLTRGALAEMRTLLLELRPSAILKTPLSELLIQLTEAIASRAGLSFQLFVEQITPLPADVQICFYRIAQESLNNVVKHARASLVSVSLSAAPSESASDGERIDEIKLVIRDDGSGFIKTEGHIQHLGLGIMRERAAAIGAELILESRPQHGAAITLTWRTDNGVKHD